MKTMKRSSTNGNLSGEEEYSKVLKDNNNSKKCKLNTNGSEALPKTCHMKFDVLEVDNKETMSDSHQVSENSEKDVEHVAQQKNNFLCRRSKFTGRKTSREGTDAFNKCSDELLLLIFQYLPQKCLIECAFVCQRWRSICYDESLWSRIDLTGKTLQSDTMAYIVSRNPRLLRMAQAEICSPVYKTYLEPMSNFVWKVEYLDLSMAVINSEDLALLLRSCFELRKLSLEHCTADVDVCSSIAQNKELDTLNMAMCYQLNIEGITKILKNCQKLKELNLAWTGLDSESTAAVCSTVNERITHLDISGCGKSMLDEHLVELLERCRSLVYLDISDCTLVTDDVFHVIINNLTNLQQLSISRCYKMSPALYTKLLSSLPKLSFLNVFGVLTEKQVELLQKATSKVSLNKTKFSTIARPTVGTRRTSIWGMRSRD